MRISTAIAVTVFNEGELCLYGIMHDLKLHPSYTSFRSLCKREHTKQLHRNYIKKANRNRRARRQKQAKLQREQQLLRLEGGQSYKSSSFGAETFTKPTTSRRARRPRRVSAATTSRVNTPRGKGCKTHASFQQPNLMILTLLFLISILQILTVEVMVHPKKSAIFAT